MTEKIRKIDGMPLRWGSPNGKFVDHETPPVSGKEKNDDAEI